MAKSSKLDWMAAELRSAGDYRSLKTEPVKNNKLQRNSRQTD